MAAGKDVPTPSESSSDVPVRHIPGFYYDKQLKRYFKVLKPEKEPNHQHKERLLRQTRQQDTPATQRAVSREGDIEES